jgi:IS605 OrfB family transposase
MKGQFWRGAEIKRVRGLYNHIRRKLQKEKLLKKVKELKGKERSKVNQQLHIIANQIVSYVKQFLKPVIVMEDLTGIRDNFRKSKELNRRFHTLPFRKLQKIIEYKALLEGIDVVYLGKKLVKNTSKTCHRCGHVAQVKGRVFKCPKCGMEYDRDLNACINIARRVMSSTGWGSREPPKPADEAGGVKPQLNAGSPALKGGVAHMSGLLFSLFLNFPACSHLNLHKPSANLSMTISNSSANTSLINGSSAKGEITRSITTSLDSTSLAMILALAPSLITQTLNGPPAVSKISSLEFGGGGQTPSLLASGIGIMS